MGVEICSWLLFGTGIILFQCAVPAHSQAGGARPRISPLPVIEGQNGASVTIVCESLVPGEAVNNILLTYDPEQNAFVSFESLPEVSLRLSRTNEFSTTTYTFGPLTPSDNGQVLACWNSGQLSANATISVISDFLPFGPAHGDSRVRTVDDGSSEEIRVGTDIVIFGSRQNRLYVNTNGVLSFGQPFPNPFGSIFNSVPIIAPFWDDISTDLGGSIYYRQDLSTSAADQVQQEIYTQFPDVGFFYPSLVFVATWDRVAAFSSIFRGRFNCFQVIIASDGGRTFVRFSYGDIQWGGSNTLIGVSAGDGINFITHPASFSSSVLLLDNTTTTYRIDTAATGPSVECSVDGEVLPDFNDTLDGPFSRFEGTFEVCVEGLYGSVCDIGWNLEAAQTLCHDQFGSGYVAEPLYGLGFPVRRYVAQYFNCSNTTEGLGNCSYDSSIDPQCYDGPHVAGVRCTENFLPFGTAHGDTRVPTIDDGSTGGIQLGTDVIIFGVRQNRLYVNTNGVISFGDSFTAFSSFGLNFNSILSPPIIAPFWDDVDIRKGGTIFYRQDFNSSIADKVQQDIYTQFPDVGFFYPSLVFVATWDSVAAFLSDFSGRFNTFQTIIASDGEKTFVRFSYGNIQWGGSSTLIGISAGNRTNSITHPASMSSSILLIDNTATTYRIDKQQSDCSVEGEILPDFNDTSDRLFRRFEGTFEICVDGFYGSVCDIGWNQEAAQTLCHDQFGSSYVAVLLYGLGFPVRRYVAQQFNCSSTTEGLGNCSYDSSVDAQCHVGPHVAGVRCIEITDFIQVRFLPFGPVHGDSRVPIALDGSTAAILLGTDIVFFGSRQNRLYVNTNGVLSLGQRFTRFSSFGSNFDSVPSPPIIAPFWDDVDIRSGGTIFYRQDFTSSVADQVQQEIYAQFPDIEFFYPSLVFVATWDRVAAFSSSFRGRFNTFQAIIATDGGRTFVRFNYGDIQWGGFRTLIGVSAGDGVNFITHPVSLSSSVLLLDNSANTYRIDSATTVECSIEGEILPYFNDTSNGADHFEGTFEICIGGLYGSVCDIDWNQEAAQTLCHSQFGSGYVSEPLYGQGFPIRRYVAQQFNCSNTTEGLGNCSYDSSVDAQCHVGPHVAGVRCIELGDFLPFGTASGDFIGPRRNDGSTGVIQLGTNVVVSGSHQNRLYVNTNGVLSFQQSYARISSNRLNFNSVASPPLIAPFWDDIDVTKGGTIYYRQDNTSSTAEQVQQDIHTEFPGIGSFYPTLVFVATWDRVQAFNGSFSGLVNTFQVVIASDGEKTFVKFNYGDIQWGGPRTLIGVSAGDQINFITHPASLSTAVLSLDNNATIYRIDNLITVECTIEGQILPDFTETLYRGLQSYLGTFEICTRGVYGSVCDIGWNEEAAQTLCHSQFGSKYIAEPLYGLGNPHRRYVAQHFDCSSSTAGLGNCTYNSSVDAQCFIAPHVAGARCIERPPTPDRVLGFCSVVVWRSPEVSCEDIRGHEVRLYHPQSAHPNVTSRVGANENFYVVKEDNLLNSDETYVQVRVIHSIGMSEWSEGVSLGCEKPTPSTEKPPRVYFELNGKIYLNNSAIAISEIGEGASALYCRTDKEECCGVIPNRFGQFYYPNGVQVPIANRQQGFYRNRGDQIIRLNRREGITLPTGTYRCEIPNADDETVKIYITLTGN